MVGIWWQMVAFAGFCLALLRLAASCLAWFAWVFLGFVGFLWVLRSYTVVEGRWDWLQKLFGRDTMS